MFAPIERVPGDVILDLIRQFREDPNPDKVDLGVGVYRDEHGVTPVMRAVKAAEQELVDHEQTKAYIGTHGDPAFAEHVTRLVLGADSDALAQHRVSATQAPGGTGALRLAADFIAQQLPGKSIWLPQPTWPNHLAIATAAGIPIQRYPYVGADNRLDADAMLAGLESIPRGDVLLLHACCHNPTGFDPSREQWSRILDVVRERELLPVIDFAYQGFGDGIDKDAWPVRLFAEQLDELLITQSCSKNFGLYRERTGCFIAIAGNTSQMENVRSQIAVIARANHSNPPAHGAAVVTTIQGSKKLRDIWSDELTAMRERIHDMRTGLVEGLGAHGLGDRFDFIGQQRGMFSYTGLDADQVAQLRDRFSIYMVASGRANVAGVSPANVDYVCNAIAEIVGK